MIGKEPDKMDKEHAKKKQRYEKPDIQVIELAAEEVLGVGCKTTDSGVPGPQPLLSCIASMCALQGS